MSASHLRFAWRTLRRHKGYTAITITGLAIGICACIAIYTIASYELSFDNFHPDRQRIYRIGGRIKEHGQFLYGEGIAPAATITLQSEIPGLEAVARYYPWPVAVTIPQKNPPLRRLDPQQIILTDSSYFSIFPYKWLAGNPSTALTQPFTVVLTDKIARSYFGDGSPESWIDRELIYSDSLHVRVSGIIKEWTGNTDFPFSDLISLSTIRSSRFLGARFHPDSWETPMQGNTWMNAFVKLAPNTSPATIEKSLVPYSTRLLALPLYRTLAFTYVLQPLSDIHFNSGYRDGMRKSNLATLYCLMGTALFILLLAVINFINLSTAQSLQRTRDTGIRKILGGSRSHLIFRFLLETALITFLASIVAILLVRPLFAVFRQWLPEGVRFRPFDPLTLLFVLGLTMVTTLLAGGYPARVLSVSGNIRLSNPQNSGRYTIRKALIVFQFTISLFFIIGSITVSRQLHFMLNSDMGFAKDAIVTVHNWGSSAAKLRLFADQIQQTTGVRDLTRQGNAPGGDAGVETTVQLEGRKDKETMVAIQAGDAHFIDFYRIPLVAGHNLLPNDSGEVLINNTYAHVLGFNHPKDAIGHVLNWNGHAPVIAGVIADYHTGALHNPIGPLLIIDMPDWENSLGIRLSAPAAYNQLKEAWHSLFPDQPFQSNFLDESIARLYHDDTQLAWLVHATTGITIFIACIGLLGLILFIVERRKKEISIRKVLGAGVADIVLLLNKEFAILIGIALLIATPLAGYALHRWLQGFAYRISIAWWTFALAGLSALTIVSLTIGFRVIRAALVNPSDNLRSE